MFPGCARHMCAMGGAQVPEGTQRFCSGHSSLPLTSFLRGGLGMETVFVVVYLTPVCPLGGAPNLHSCAVVLPDARCARGPKCRAARAAVQRGILYRIWRPDGRCGGDEGAQEQVHGVAAHRYSESGPIVHQVCPTSLTLCPALQGGICPSPPVRPAVCVERFSGVRARPRAL